MASRPDPWAVLGVDRSATDEEIRTAYRARSMLLHPDLHQDRPAPVRREAARAMAQLTDAYEALRAGGAAAGGSRAAGGGGSVAYRLGRLVGRAVR
ncbi:MAG TPA: J domain-containing protein [Acidimicrobiales bacterium]|nr:J domain-containing protein [Acidimicrobiales bacterium]